MKKTGILLFIGVILVTLSCEKAPTEVTWKYEYEVTGTSGSYDVTIQNTDNNTQQWSNIGNGWNYWWTQKLTIESNGEPVKGNTRWLYCSAQNNNSSGNVTVTIKRNGKIVASNTGFGGYTIATVSGDY